MKRHRRDAGFSLAALIFFATAACILAAAAVPAYEMQAKRERERELIFRGEEYTRAIQKYQQKFGVYPGSIDQLVQANGLRFLRRAYKDPITGKDFRLIRINPDGSLSGSKVFTQNVNNPQSLFGNTQTFGRQPGTQQQPMQQQLQDILQQLGQQPLSEGQQQLQDILQQPGQQLPSQGQQQQQQQPSPQSGQVPGQPGGLSPIAPMGNAGGTPIAGGGVIGVASDSGETSIMIYNQRQKYNEWEFLAILGQLGRRGQQPQRRRLAGQQPQTNPFGGPAAPFGPQPGPTPFGPGLGQQPGQQPFSPGNPAMLPAQPGPNTPGKLP